MLSVIAAAEHYLLPLQELRQHGLRHSHQGEENRVREKLTELADKLACPPICEFGDQKVTDLAHGRLKAVDRTGRKKGGENLPIGMMLWRIDLDWNEPDDRAQNRAVGAPSSAGKVLVIEKSFLNERVPRQHPSRLS